MKTCLLDLLKCKTTWFTFLPLLLLLLKVGLGFEALHNERNTDETRHNNVTGFGLENFDSKKKL